MGTEKRTNMEVGRDSVEPLVSEASGRKKFSQRKEVTTSNVAGKSSGPMELTNMWAVNDFRDSVVSIE